eukprot:c7346_g1_i1.p1 GENE.c7346_g1_i1~~c7346_g1_i1.p1  ORF type:complete len:490 (-),score=143.11 c7346_g1_i1:42-1331(-)
MYKLLFQISVGLMMMSADILIRQLDIKQRHSEDVFLEFSSAFSQSSASRNASRLDFQSFLEVKDDICDPDIDPIIIFLDWAQFYVENVYEVMEKFIRKLREEEGAQQLGSGGEHMTPGQALIQLRKWMNDKHGTSKRNLEDPDPEFHHRTPVREDEKQLNNRESLAELLRSGISAISKQTHPEPQHESLIPQFGFQSSDSSAASDQANLLREAITRSSDVMSLLEVSTQTETGQNRILTELYLRYFNILMWWCARISMDKDDKIGMALLEIEESIGMPQRPGSPEGSPPSWADAMTARKEACDHNSCIHGGPDEDLEYHRKVAVKIEREASRHGIGPVKHLPAPQGIDQSDDSGWSWATTLEMAKSSKQQKWSALAGMGTRPVASRGADCGPFFRKAIQEMVILGWMTWWSMYYTILSWLKTDTNKADE